jgi:hypothetical protein
MNNKVSNYMTTNPLKPPQSPSHVHSSISTNQLIELNQAQLMGVEIIHHTSNQVSARRLNPVLIASVHKPGQATGASRVASQHSSYRRENLHVEVSVSGDSERSIDILANCIDDAAEPSAINLPSAPFMNKPVFTHNYMNTSSNTSPAAKSLIGNAHLGPRRALTSQLSTRGSVSLSHSSCLTTPKALNWREICQSLMAASPVHSLSMHKALKLDNKLRSTPNRTASLLLNAKPSPKRGKLEDFADDAINLLNLQVRSNSASPAVSSRNTRNSHHLKVVNKFNFNSISSPTNVDLSTLTPNYLLSSSDVNLTQQHWDTTDLISANNVPSAFKRGSSPSELLPIPFLSSGKNRNSLLAVDYNAANYAKAPHNS